MNSTITQRDIAERLNLSQATVADALNGRHKTAERTRLIVERTAQEMGYVRGSNFAARAMASQRHAGKKTRTHTLAVMQPMASELDLRNEAFFAEFLQGIEAEAQEQELDVFTFRRREQTPRMVAEGGVDGVVALYALLGSELPQVEGLPIVSLYAPVEGVHSIVADDREGMRCAVRHLIEIGHRDIGYLSTMFDHPTARERFRGYRDALEEAGLEYRPQLVEGKTHDMASIEDSVRALVEQKVSAIACYNDFMAMGTVRWLGAKGLRVPHDISVTGFDDTSGAHHFHPEITSVGFDRIAMGRRAVRWVVEQDGHATPDETARREVFPVRLAVHESSAPCRK